MNPDVIANQTILATVATFVTAMGTLANEASIRVTRSSTGSSYRVDSNLPRAFVAD